MTCVLITGQQWPTEQFIERFYGDKIRAAFFVGKRFAVGGADGVDRYAQQLLADLCAASGDESTYKRVTVYMKGERDGRLDQRFVLKNGYESYPDRDIDMGKDCDEAIYCSARYESGVTGALLPWLIVTRKALRKQAIANNEPLSTIKMSELIIECVAICNAMREACEPHSDEISKPIKAIYNEIYN